jgi:hypothetical protein
MASNIIAFEHSSARFLSDILAMITPIDSRAE